MPAVPRLSRVGWLMWPLDTIDRALCWPWQELRGLPPNRLRIRVGVGNRILFNGAHFVRFPVNFWLEALAAGVVRPDSNIVDLGSGCGRFAAVWRDFMYHGRGFTGVYTGVDIDEEMLAWCRGHFPPERFAWINAGMASSVYNPGGAKGPVRLAIEDATQDFVLSNSLFTHLVEDDFAGYIREAARILKAGGAFQISVLVIEDVRERERATGRAGRWAFEHRLGRAWVESMEYPEAAVAYEWAFIEETCRGAGLGDVERMPMDGHTVVRWRKAAGA